MNSARPTSPIVMAGPVPAIHGSFASRLTPAFERLHALFEGGKALIDLRHGVAPKNALAVQGLTDIVEPGFEFTMVAIDLLLKLARALLGILQHLANVAENAQRLVLRFRHAQLPLRAI